MQTQKRPSVGELIEHAEHGDAAEVETKLRPLSQAEQLVISAILEKYLSVETSISKVAIFHAASRYLAGETELNDTEAPIDRVLADAEQIRKDIKEIENAITRPEEVVVRNDRSGDLGEASSVLQGNAVAKIYGYNGRNTTMTVGSGSRKSIPLRPLLNGVVSADQVRDNSNARWAINQNAVEARFEQWCNDIDKETSLTPELDNMVKKRKIMRIFNTYIDVISETTNTFLQDNDVLQQTIDDNLETIVYELVAQMQNYVTKHIQNHDPAEWTPETWRVIKKYRTAFEALQLPLQDFNPSELLDSLKEAARMYDSSTSQLCGVA